MYYNVNRDSGHIPVPRQTDAIARRFVIGLWSFWAVGEKTEARRAATKIGDRL